MNFFRKVLWIFVHPFKALCEINDSEEVSFKGPLTLLFILALLSSINTYLIFNKISVSLSAEISPFLTLGGIFGSIGSFISVFVAWIIYSAFFHVLALLFRGEGNFKKLLEMFGWSYTPKIISSVVSLVITLFFFPALPEIKSFVEIPKVFEAMSKASCFTFTRVLDRLTLFWVLFLFGIALWKNHKLRKIEVLVIILLPTLLYFALTYFFFPSIFSSFQTFPR